MKIKPSDDSLVGPILLYLEKNVFSRQQIEPDLQLWVWCDFICATQTNMQVRARSDIV